MTHEQARKLKPGDYVILNGYPGIGTVIQVDYNFVKVRWGPPSWGEGILYNEDGMIPHTRNLSRIGGDTV